MTDFLFTRDKKSLPLLVQPLKDLMPEPETVIVKEYSGNWGALAVSLGPYNGFAPYENDTYVCAVIGGPVLYWQDNDFLTGLQQSTIATKAILKHWQSGIADWSEDLSGPFTIFIVNKKSGELFCYTDLMMFIPVYQYIDDTKLCLGTHVDAVAKISGKNNNIDDASIADFILHGVVTYPYTIYTHLFQLAPATEHNYSIKNSKNINQRNSYWEPLEVNPYKNIDDAAIALRVGLTNYIERITDNMTEVGQFLSAGEDSRSIAGLLPSHLKRHAYIFVDSKNREFKLAKRVANAYDCEFHYILRDPMHYLYILPDASKLIGGGQQYTHAHTLNLVKECGANKHLAVFGGFISDSLLKGVNTKKNKINEKILFLPEFFINHREIEVPDNIGFFNNEVIDEVIQRRLAHFEYIKGLRKESSYEWFYTWPISMKVNLPNISVNRRLFPSYEVFASKEVVKVSATVPIQWKLNRRLFHKAFNSSLKASKWIPHSDGRLPYYPWHYNSFLQLPAWFKRRFDNFSGNKDHNGSWSNWESVVKDNEWIDMVNSYLSNIGKINIKEEYLNKEYISIYNSLDRNRKINLLQTLFLIDKLDIKI